MTTSFIYAVLSLDHALIWKGDLKPGSKPVRLEESVDNPQYTKEHKSRVGNRDRSTLDAKFAENIAEHFRDASHIYLLSAGSGKASSAHQLLDFLKEKHPAIAEKVLGTGTADVRALSDNQLLELGRDRRNLFI